MANRFVQAPSHGGGFRSGQPTIIVIHSLEAPARRGLAYDLATGWLQGAGVSPHALTDPGETVDTCSESLVGWHCGNGNQVGIGLEVTGYAAWDFNTWTTGDNFAAVRLDAKRAAEAAKRHGIPLRWLSLSQIRNGERGFCTHADISATLGGTNHTDPGKGFPFAIFMQMVQQWAGGVVDPNPNPNPQPGDGPGGAQPKDWWDEMSDSEKAQLLVDVAEIKARLRGSDPNIDSLQALSMGLTAANRGITSIGAVVGDALGPVTDASGNRWPFRQAIASMADRIYRLASQSDSPKD